MRAPWEASVVDLLPVRETIATTIEATEPDGRYALEDAKADGSTFASAWHVSPDSDRELSPRDLYAAIHIGAARVAGDQLEYQVLLLVMTADYPTTRTSYGSSVELAALTRAHGAALHLMDRLERAPIPEGRLTPTDYDRPRPTPDGLWLSTVIGFTLTIARR
jgi:hypothetical protein